MHTHIHIKMTAELTKVLGIYQMYVFFINDVIDMFNIVQIPQRQIDFLPANFFVNNLLSMVALHEDSGGSSLECDNCESGDPPVNRCATCSHFLCEFCTQAHRRGRNTSSHSVMSLEEAKKMGSAAVTKPSICKEHDGEMIKLFCETCEEAICRDCTIVKHRDHKYTFVKDIFLKGKESLLKILSETKAKEASLKEALDGVLEKKKRVNSRAELTVEEVVECFKDLRACLDTRCSELVTQIAGFQIAKLMSLEIQQETLETALASVQSSLDFTEKALENGSEVEILNMRKQMSSRLQDLNSSNWQLKPCIDEGLTFKGGHQLKLAIASFGVVTDVVTSASMTTVTMGNGEEGVMYNTLCGQLVKFTIISKEYSGRKKVEGGDIFTVFVKPFDLAGRSARLKVRDHENGTYSFCLDLSAAGSYQLSVQLNDHHVQGSPFTWTVEKWNLEVFPLNGRKGQRAIKLSEENLTAEYYKLFQSDFSQHHQFYQNQKPVQFGRSPILMSGSPNSNIIHHHQRQPLPYHFNQMRPQWIRQVIPNEARSDISLYAVGSVGFVNGKHMWKVQIYGEISRGLSFGVVNVSKSDENEIVGLEELNWVCCPKEKNFPLGCDSGDIIELYLNFDSKKLVIYNPRTKHSETWEGVEGDVFPVFHMVTIGDKVSLKIPGNA